MESIMNEATIAAAGIALLVGLVMQGIKQLETVNNKYIPLLSMALGIVIGVLLAVSFGFAVNVYVLAGLLGGAAASGVYDGLAIKKGDE